jgi:hypothetical protein
VGTVTGQTIKMHSNASKKHRFFAIIDRTNMTAAGGEARVADEVNAFRLAQEPGIVEFQLVGTTYGKRCHGGLVIHEIDASGDDGVDIEPCVLPGETSPDQFGVEWAPLGPPSANTGQTDWAFLSKLATDSAPVERMRISVSSNGAAVSLFVQPGPTQTPDFRIVLRNSGQVVAEFVHSASSTPFAELPDWPIAVGYRELVHPDQPWSMWIGLGYAMNVTIPGGPVATSTAAALSLVQSDLIEVIAQGTPNPGPSEKKILSGRFAGFPFILIRDDRPTPTRVGHSPRATQTVLRPAYPNPFNPRTTLAFDLAQGGRVSLKIYAVGGHYVATVHEGTLNAGPHTYQWNGVDHRGQPVATGVYLARLESERGTSERKLVLLK